MIKKLAESSNLSKEKNKRQREVWLAVTFFLIAVCLSWLELKYAGGDSYFFLALFNINVLLLLTVLFLVFRNILKLVTERRRKVFGSKLRTRLVLTFVSLAIVPVTLMFLFSVRLVQTSVDYLFRVQVDESIQQAVNLGQIFYASIEQDMKRTGLMFLSQLGQKKIVAADKKIERIVLEKKAEWGLDLLGFLDATGKKQYWAVSKNWEKVWPQMKEKFEREKGQSERKFFTSFYQDRQNDCVLSFLEIDSQKDMYLVLGKTLKSGVLNGLDGIARGAKEYQQVKNLKDPLKLILYIVLALITLLILLASIWFGFRLAREISLPLLAVAEATKEVAIGNLNVFIEDRADDEINVLISSFNQMAKDLKLSQENLLAANTCLEQQNLELEARRQYAQAIMDNITAGVIALDHEGKIMTVNHAAEKILRVRASALLGRDPVQFLPDFFRRLVQDMKDFLYENPFSRWQRQVTVTFSDHNDIRLLISAVVLDTPEVHRRGIVAVFEDITEMEKMQRLDAWKEVARRIAHEIKNPLTPIKLSAQRLEKKFAAQITDSVFSDCTALIVRQVEILQRMFSDFSSFAQLPQQELAEGDIVPLLQETVSDFAQTQSQITWYLDAGENIPGFYFDSGGIRQVLTNLFLNATQVMQGKTDGKVWVAVSFDAQARLVRLTVMDNGPGLDPEELSRLFEPYYSRRKGGTGLGLTIVRSILLEHNATIRAESSGHGSVFIIEFDIKDRVRMERDRV